MHLYVPMCCLSCGIGVLESFTREVAMEKIADLGGVVRSGVSGKTDYLVIGHVLEDGRPIEFGSKFRKTTELNEGKRKENPIEILDEAKFQVLIGDTSATSSEEKEEEPWVPPSGSI